MAVYHFNQKSQKLGFPVEVCAYIPNQHTDIPTLWLLHGANSECLEWFRESSLLRYLRGRSLAVVSVSIHNGFYVNMAYGAAYASFLEEEWVPMIRGLFPCLSRDRAANYLAGASMGGFGAFRLGVNRPDLFGKVGSFAGSIEMPTIVERYERGIQPGGDDFDWAFNGYKNMINNSNDVVYMARQCVKEGVMPKLWMLCGTSDFGYALNTIARDDLRAVGASVQWHETEGVHSFDCWDPMLPSFLDWLEDKEVS